MFRNSDCAKHVAVGIVCVMSNVMFTSFYISVSSKVRWHSLYVLPKIAYICSINANSS